jgi:hypothetical protein
MPNALQIRLRRRVRGGIRVDGKVEEAEARRLAALDAHFGAGPIR